MSHFSQEKAVARHASEYVSKSVNLDLSLSVDGPAPGVASLPTVRGLCVKDWYKNITLLGPAVPAAETWWQDGADRWAHQDDDSAGFREDDLYTRPTAAIVATIPVIVSLVCTTFDEH